MAAKQAITLVNGTAITATGTTSAQELGPRFNRWAAFISVGTVTGTSPTLDLKVQHSSDGTNWVDLIAFTQVTASSAVEHKFAATDTFYLRPLLPYVRASYTVGGTGSPTFNTVTAKLLVDF